MGFIINYHKSWKSFFEREDIRQEIVKIENLIGDDYFPSKENVFRFAKQNLNEIKYIIVGMEPYPSSFNNNGVMCPEATGRSFEVASLKGKTWADKFKQTSLRNIVKTIYYNDTGDIISLDALRKKIINGEFNISNPSDWFDKTEEQGVLWLNATLTVKPYVVDTHAKYWEYFMNELIKYISYNNPDVFWVLWGNNAKTRVENVIGNKNTICTVHPRLASFVNENCFKTLNKVNWKV